MALNYVDYVLRGMNSSSRDGEAWYTVVARG
jgi:hypothetical protein